MRLLLAEDEPSLARALKAILEKNNYAVDCVENGAEALDYLDSSNYDGVILDVMMPVMDGFSALRQIRASGNPIPVLMLTARSEVDDKVLGLDSGANDYLTKPFETKELLARLRVMLRVQAAQTDPDLHFANLDLDVSAFTLSSPSGSFRLTNKEFQMMEMLMRRPGQLIPAELFFDRIWGLDSDVEISVVPVYLSYLRKKLAALKADAVIRVSRGVGYSLEEGGTQA